MGRGWWLGCTQELFEGQGKAHMASIRAMLKSRHVEEGDVGHVPAGAGLSHALLAAAPSTVAELRRLPRTDGGIGSP